MKKKTVGKKNLKILAATSMAIFSLFTCFAGAYAWFVAMRHQEREITDFEVVSVDTSVVSISLHDFYGTSAEEGTKYYGFNPLPNGVLDYSDPDHPSSDGSVSVQLGPYSLDDPHHPVLILFEIDGAYETVIAETIYPFLPQNKPGDDELGNNYVVNTYSALEAKKSIANDGDYFEVLHDESQNGTYVEEETIYRVKTRYQYHADTDEFEFVWADLAMFSNPLSSAIQSHSFLFDFIKPYKQQGAGFIVNSETDALDVHDYTYYDNGVKRTVEDQTGIWIPINEFKEKTDANTNMASFASFSANGSYLGFDQESTFFDGSVEGHTFLGLVIDYYPLALEYLSSYYLGHRYLTDGLTFKCDWVTKI